MINIKEALLENLKYIESPATPKGQVNGLTTGFNSLDSKLLGLRPGKLIVIGGRPGMGKSALALNFALAAAKQTPQAVAIFSFEMLYGEISMRLLSTEAKIPRRNFETKELSEKESKAISGAVQRLAGLHLYIEDSGNINLDQMREKCLKLKAESGLTMIVIDYFQLIPMSNSTLDDTVRSLKDLAVELEVPIVIVAQLKRPKKNPGRRPMLKDLRDVGALENLADAICFIYREDYYDANSSKKGIAEIIIPRNRDGEPGTVEIRWHGSQLRFSDYNED